MIIDGDANPTTYQFYEGDPYVHVIIPYFTTSASFKLTIGPGKNKEANNYKKKGGGRGEGGFNITKNKNKNNLKIIKERKKKKQG